MRIKDFYDCMAKLYYRPLGEKGEDAFSYNLSSKDVHFQAVFDGCGGAGAWKYPEYGNATGAFMAAHSMSEAFSEWTKSVNYADVRDEKRLAEKFRIVTEKTLRILKEKSSPMGISGNLVKSFPCTSAVSVVDLLPSKKLQITSLNAGDSRVYFLTPNNGLVQLTKDDSRGNPDPLQSLRDSAPMSNVLNADKPFKITASRIQTKLPCAVICATDGVFGFVRSPMDFEYILLKCIVSAKSIVDFESKFETRIKEITGDDSTMLISFYGWSSYAAIVNSLRKRYLYVESLIKRIDACKDDMEKAEAVMHEQWASYKKETVYDEGWSCR